jgi:DNA-binding transcriptional LysR family regulator
MDRVEAMAMLVAAVDTGSLAAASRKVGRSPASVTRAVTLLEDLAGDRLLHRSTRRLKLTEVGERHVAVYRHVLLELADVADNKGTATEIEGSVTMTAPELFGRLKLMPVVEDFLAGQPGVRARVLLLNRVVDLVQEGIDVAVRFASLPDSGLIAVKLGEMRRLVCAAPAYIDRMGMPGRPADLPRHVCLGDEDGGDRLLWHFVDRTSVRHRALSIAVAPRIALNSAGAAVDSAVRGSGICRAMAYQVADHIDAGRLVPLLSDVEQSSVPVHLVFHPIPRRNRALRAFVDVATPRLRDEIASVAKRVDRRSQD